MQPPLVSVLLCSFNPHDERFRTTLEGLSAQSLATTQWDLVIVDNASCPAIADLPFLLPPNARIVNEPTPGLIHARLAGLRATRAEIVIFCDDDNVLAPNYVARAVEIMACDPSLGVASGRSRPEFERQPEAWVTEFFGCLALYDHGEQVRIASGTQAGYPPFAGGGCGAVFRREALESCLQSLMQGDEIITGRRGMDLTSGEDNDLVLRLLAAGWKAGYFPGLELTHLIPSGRVTRAYLARLNEAIARSWVKVLDRHGLNPWRATPRALLPLQIMRAFVRYRAWSGPAAYVRWRGACGQFRGRADLHEAGKRAAISPRDRLAGGQGA